MERLSVIDSHTGGEPTRVVIAGGPDLGTGTVADRQERFRIRFDRYRSAIVNEPRGSDVLVGALVVEPLDPGCAVGVIYFNNVGFLGMCGHGTIGLMVTLAHLGRIGPGTHRIETAVGEVQATLHADQSVTLANVPSRRAAADVVIALPGTGSSVVRGDVAWGGNWFFLVKEPVIPLSLDRVDELTELSWRIRQAVNQQGYPEVDHVELFGPPLMPSHHSRNFVLCPGKAYDRSPCGTGTSAKLACLAADGKLDEGQAWVQESILGSTFTGQYRWQERDAGWILPTITGTAHLTAESTLLLDERDPFRWGVRTTD